MKRIATLIFLLFVARGGYAQPDTTRGIFLEDFDYFIGKLQQTHPDPYSAYGGRVEFYRQKQALRDRLRGETDTLAFVRELRAFLSPMRDAHTWISNPSTPPAGEIKYMPFKLAVSMDGIYICDAGPDNGELLGGLITEIEGVSIDELAERMSRLSAAENRYGNYRNLVNQLGGSIYAGRLLGDTKDTLRMAVLKDGNREEIEVVYTDTPFETNREGILPKCSGILFTHLFAEAGYFRWNSVQSRELIEGNRRSGYDTDFLFDWAFSYLDDERTGDYETDIQKIPYLYSTVAQLLKEMDVKGIRNLIIDLRSNSGGMTPLVYPLMRMLCGDDFPCKKVRSGIRCKAFTDAPGKEGL